MQTNYFYPTNMRASNDAYASTTEATIIDTSTQGYTSFNLTATNYGSVTVSDINIYASADGFNYYSVQADAINTLAAGATKNYTFTHINRFIRVTAVSASSTAHISCTLIGVV